MTRDRRIPTGRLGRVARMALLGARTGAGMFLDGEGKATAKNVADVLGTMRGLAAKAGQMASYVDGIVPEGQREAFEEALASLRDAAPTSSPEAVAAVVEAELGESVDALFASWETEPLASASIGQVHRATLADGRRVAVKVQHPGIERALDHDLRNAGLMAGLKGAFLGAKFETGRVMDEMDHHFREELDYALEAERQETFRTLFAEDPAIAIPAVVAERSSRRVLCTELVEGLDFAAACAAPEALRRQWAEALWRFVFRSSLVGGLFNADPHPGNYFFHEDGTVTVLDFGCVVPVTDAHRARARAVHAAACAGDEAAFRAAGKRMMKTRGGDFEVVILDYLRLCFEPLFVSPFHLTRDYAASLVAEMIQGAKVGLKVSEEEFVPMPEGMALMNRLQFGFYSVLARLDVAADYREVERAFLA